TVGPLLLGGSLSLGGYLMLVSSWVGGDVFSGFSGLMTRLLPTVLAIFAFSVFYVIVPNKPVRVRDGLIGGITAGVLFGILRKLFTLYFTAFPAYQTMYGALSMLPIFLIWMYLSWAIVLIGAEVTASLSLWSQARVAQSFDSLVPARQLETCLAALENLWRKSRRQSDVNPDRSRARSDELDEALDVLRQKGFTGLSDAGEWLIVRDIETITLSCFAHGLGIAPNPNDLKQPARRKWQGELHKALQGDKGAGMGRTLRQLFEGKA
ncbi:MAG: YihY family inner membrane protein, partial [Magnetovibrio sp.]|nr:YihY family inner membrane protein [Magnetovibrio sp.]